MQIKPIETQLAREAVHRWHYSHAYPAAPVALYGVYDPDFVGAVVFGRGATPEIGKPFGLDQADLCELTRVALTRHQTPTSKIVAVALRLLRRDRPHLRLVVSFADTAQGHVGTIYQASNWLYLGAKTYHAYKVNGEIVHPRTLYSRYGRGGQSIPWLRANVDPEAERVQRPPKHKYVYPFDSSLKIEGLAYPASEVQTAARGVTNAEGTVQIRS